MLEFARKLGSTPAPDWEHQPWTEGEIHELMNLKPMDPAAFATWLKADPPTEQWGNLADNEDAADYIHQMRRETRYVLDEPESGR